MKELLIVAPVVALYSPIVSLTRFVTNRFPPDNAMPRGKSNPEEMKAVLIGAPVVALYSPIVLLPRVRDKQIPSGQRDATRLIQPRRNEGGVDRCPGGGVVFANRVVARFVTNRFPPENAMPRGSFNPEEMKELLIGAPVVALYSPIVLLPELATNRFPPNNAMPFGKSNPEEMKELLIVAPVVALYSPIVLLNSFVTKI